MARNEKFVGRNLLPLPRKHKLFLNCPKVLKNCIVEIWCQNGQILVMPLIFLGKRGLYLLSMGTGATYISNSIINFRMQTMSTWCHGLTLDGLEQNLTVQIMPFYRGHGFACLFCHFILLQIILQTICLFVSCYVYLPWLFF